MFARARLRSSSVSSPDQTGALPEEISAATILDVIGDARFAESGQALVVSLAPIKASLGPRWARRRTRVYEVVERYFRRHLAATDIWRVVSESYFLVLMPEKTAQQAQSICCQAISDVMVFFLGQVAPHDIEVCRITSLSDDRIEVRSCAEDEFGRPDGQTAASSVSDLTSWPLGAADGQKLHVVFTVEPVLDLNASAMAGHRIESRIMDLQTGRELTGRERRMLPPRDLEKIDLAALEHGLAHLRGKDVTDKARLIIQLSFVGLSDPGVRAALLEQAHGLLGDLGQAAICELMDVEAGVPPGRLVEVISPIRGHFRGIFVQVEPKANAVDSAMAADVYGLTVRAADLGGDEASICAGARDFMPLMKLRRTGLTVTGLPTPNPMADVQSAGFTHASLRAVAVG